MPVGPYKTFPECVSEISRQARKAHPDWTEEHVKQYAGGTCYKMEQQAQGLMVAYQAKFEPYSKGDRHFIKVHNVDDSWNRNGWAVTDQARKDSLTSFFRQPLLGPKHLSNEHVADMDPRHPHYGTWAKIGQPVDVINNGVTYGIYEITVPQAWDMIQAGELGPVSPSVRILEETLQPDGGKLITKFVWDHTLFVDIPAFPHAGVVGTCTASDPSLCGFAQAAQAAYIAQGIRVKAGDKTIDLVFNPDDFKDVEEFVKKVAELGVTEADARKAWTDQQQIVKGHVPDGSTQGGKTDGAGYSQRGNLTDHKPEENILGVKTLSDKETEQGCKEAQAQFEVRLKELEGKTAQAQSTAPQDKPNPEQVAQAQKIKDLEARLQARDEAELSVAALGVATIEAQAGLIKADKTTERVVELKKLGAPALIEMQARYKVLVEKVQAATEPRQAHHLKADFDDAIKDPAQASSVIEQIRQASFGISRTPEDIAKLEKIISGVRQ
jgi:hypothetical protein